MSYTHFLAIIHGLIEEGSIADVHDLAKFTQLNYTGFQKIIKKHDVSFSPPPSLINGLYIDT